MPSLDPLGVPWLIPTKMVLFNKFSKRTTGPLIVLGEGRLNFGHQRRLEDQRVDFFRQTPSSGGREG